MRVIAADINLIYIYNNTKAQYTRSSNDCQIFYSRSNDLLKTRPL